MIKRFLLSGFFIGFFLNLSQGFSSPKSLEKVMGALEQSLKSLEDFQADFEQTESNSLMNRKKKSKGIIHSLSGGRIFWHTKEPSSLKVISDGETIWLFYPETKQLFIEKWGKLDNQTKLAILFLRREGNLKAYFKMRWKNELLKIVELHPKRSMGVEKIWLTLTSFSSQDTVFFEKIVFFFPLGRKTELFLKNIKKNQHLWTRYQKSLMDENIDSQFRFKPMKNLHDFAK